MLSYNGDHLFIWSSGFYGFQTQYIDDLSPEESELLWPRRDLACNFFGIDRSAHPIDFEARRILKELSVEDPEEEGPLEYTTLSLKQLIPELTEALEYSPKLTISPAKRICSHAALHNVCDP